MGAGAVVGLAAVATALTVVPPREPAAIRTGDPAVLQDGTGADPIVGDAADTSEMTPVETVPEDPVVEESESIFSDPPSGGVKPEAADLAVEEGTATDDSATQPEAPETAADDVDLSATTEAPVEETTGPDQPLGTQAIGEEPFPSASEEDEAASIAPSPGGVEELTLETTSPEPSEQDAQSPVDTAPEEAEPIRWSPQLRRFVPRAPTPVDVQVSEADLQIEPFSDEFDGGAVASPPAVPVEASALPAFDSTVPQPSRPSSAADTEPQLVAEVASDTIETPADDRPALVRNAAMAPPAGNPPLLAIVLVDDLDAGLIADLPLSVAIAADAEGARPRAEAWREAGAEIVAIPGLTDDADGTGSVALFDATFEALPGAATVMAESEQGFANGPVAADQVAATLAETGHGLIARGRDLGPFAQAAERAGVPTVGIFRRVDGSGRDGRAIGRFLDQAAFEARNRGSVVVIADNSPDTAAGIAYFMESARADSVALVPVSVVLRSQGFGG